METTNSTLAELTKAIRMMTIVQRDVMDSEDAALYLGIEQRTLMEHARRGDVPYYPHGRRLWFRRSELDQWILTNRSASQEEIERMARAYARKLKNGKV